jgi:tetratricopeptide (TPR) repeat protein
MDELKNNEPARAIFESSILAELKNRDERLASISNFEGFEREFGKILPTLTRIEDKLDAVADVGQETNDMVKLITRMLVERSGEQPTPEQLEHLTNELAELNKELAAKDEVIRLKDDEINSWPQQLADFKRERASRYSAEASKQQEEIGQKLDDFDFSAAGQLLDELIEKKEDNLGDLVVSLIDRAKVYELQFRWDQAVATRERAVAICPDDTELRFGLAQLLAKQNRFDPAIGNYKHLIEHAADESSRAGYLNNLANLYSATDRLGQAESAFDEALDLYRDLARVNPDAYHAYVAATLNNLAVFYKDTG